MNKIKNWSYDKPTCPGLYMICNGDIEVIENMEPLRITELEPYIDPSKISTWPMASVREVSTWNNSWKFARLVIGTDVK